MHKAPGPDGPNWILRDFCGQLSGPVCAIFNASIREGTVPALWKEANVIPVPKAHQPQLIETDLRLTPTLSKLLESFIGAWTGLKTNWMSTVKWSVKRPIHDTRSGGHRVSLTQGC